MSVQPLILVISAADTGRGPLTAALLRRLLEKRGLTWLVSSAGIVGHDEAPAQVEARDAAKTLGLDLGNHIARSLTEELAGEADLLLTPESGIAKVIKLRHPTGAAKVFTLGELAQRHRDIPDPFRMQLGAWVIYARETDALLQKGLELLIAKASGPPARVPQLDASPASFAPAKPAEEPSRARTKPLERSSRLLALLRESPDLVVWENARRQLELEIKAAAKTIAQPTDLALPYSNLLLTLLNLLPTLPPPDRLAALQTAIEGLLKPIDQQSFSQLALLLATWSAR